MGKTYERLQGYQTQMSIYAEQHKMLLASDVLDMIEQLQDDLKDDVDAVVAELEKELKLADAEKERCAKENPLQFDTAKGYANGVSIAIDIVRNAGKEVRNE